MAVNGIRAACQQMADARGKPCLLFVCDFIQRGTVLKVKAAIQGVTGDHLDVVIISPGGDPHAAYLLARELRRRFSTMAVLVPLHAKSGATLICLAAQELILGGMGELGPIDMQVSEKQAGDSPAFRSGVAPILWTPVQS